MRPAILEQALTLPYLAGAYAKGDRTPLDVVAEILARIDRDRDKIRHVWLQVEDRAALEKRAQELMRRKAAGERLPLFGVPFGVKDNIDVAFLPTTVACPALTRTPSAHATVVRRLLDAGAIFVGKTNLDQLATGLVGTRSPYGVPTNPFDPAMIPGGSSSGSAVAVAAGHVPFALGTDTAGSGRVPAGFNNVVGLKPTRGLLSTTGVVPACRSLDSVSVFALTVADASAIADVAKGFDESDPYSRTEADRASFLPRPFAPGFRFGVPGKGDLVFFDDEQARRRFAAGVAELEALGGQRVDIDFAPLRNTGRLLYDGPFVAERLHTAGRILAENPEALLPVIREILNDARRVDAEAAFRGQNDLERLRRDAARTWSTVDIVVVPTAPTIYTIDAVAAEPRAKNATLGTYTHFVNLLDWAALAVPCGFREDGLPSGITLIGPRGSDGSLATVGHALQTKMAGPLGATGQPYRQQAALDVAMSTDAHEAGDHVPVAVVGAHLSGLPLNHQLTRAGATLMRRCKTAPIYRLFALAGTVPPKPGMVRVNGGESGAAIEAEVWALPKAEWGTFVAGIPAPLCIGSVMLEDQTAVHGFLCESYAIAGARDISPHGGWRAYLSAQSEPSGGKNG